MKTSDRINEIDKELDEIREEIRKLHVQHIRLHDPLSYRSKKLNQERDELCAELDHIKVCCLYCEGSGREDVFDETCFVCSGRGWVLAIPYEDGLCK